VKLKSVFIGAVVKIICKYLRNSKVKNGKTISSPELIF
jgi:hypothetical protein